MGAVEKACAMTGHLLIILAAVVLIAAIVVGAYLIAAAVAAAEAECTDCSRLTDTRDNPRHQSPDEQRLPVTCTCGARRFCDGGCGAGGSVHADGDTDVRQ